MNLNNLTNENLEQRLVVMKGNVGSFMSRMKEKFKERFQENPANPPQRHHKPQSPLQRDFGPKRVSPVSENNFSENAFKALTKKLDIVLQGQKRILEAVRTSLKPAGQIREAKKQTIEEKKRNLPEARRRAEASRREALYRKYGRKPSRKPRWRNARVSLKGIGFVSGIYGDFLNSLPMPNWQSLFGGMPQTPGYPSVPKLCPKSIYTNLKRIFFSGINLITEIQRLAQQSDPITVANYIKGKKQEWRSWIQRVKNYHGRTPDKQKLITKIWNVLNYIFDLPIEDFLEEWEKIVFVAYQPQQLEGYIKRFFK